MTEGGTLAWKRQVIVQSRGPSASYDSKSMRLPAELPEGVAWQQNTETREWTLVRLDHPQQQRQKQQKYRLERTMAWNPHTGREQWSIKLRPAYAGGGGMNLSKKVTEESDEDTVDTSIDSVTTANTRNTVSNDLDSLSLGENAEYRVPEDGRNRRMLEPPVLGKDYVVHTILSSDTFQGLLLRYKIKAVELRRINQFSGTNLALAPSHLIIPLTGGRSLGSIRSQDTNSAEYKLQLVLTEHPYLTANERKAYLEMHDWDVDAALNDIRNDVQWEEDQEMIQTVQRKMEELKLPTTVAAVDPLDEASSLSTPLLTSVGSEMKPLEVEFL